MFPIFANTGIQLICVPLASNRRYTSAQIGFGWQRCVTLAKTAADHSASEAKSLPFVQWQIIQSQASRLFLAIDTSLGDPSLGFICAGDALAGDHRLTIGAILDLAG